MVNKWCVPPCLRLLTGVSSLKLGAGIVRAPLPLCSLQEIWPMYLGMYNARGRAKGLGNVSTRALYRAFKLELSSRQSCTTPKHACYPPPSFRARALFQCTVAEVAWAVESKNSMAPCHVPSRPRGLGQRVICSWSMCSFGCEGTWTGLEWIGADVQEEGGAVALVPSTNTPAVQQQ